MDPPSEADHYLRTIEDRSKHKDEKLAIPVMRPKQVQSHNEQNMKQVIVTLTTIPPRFHNLGAKFKSLERQSAKPDRVQLTIPKTYRRFPGERPSLPALPDWVEVFESKTDYGPATKLLPAVHRWAGSDVDLLICDDDRMQDKNWIQRLKSMRTQRPDDIICERGWNIAERFGIAQLSPKMPRAAQEAKGGRTLTYRMKRILSLNMDHPPRRIYIRPGYVDVFEGFLGALIPNTAISKTAFSIPEIIWTVDDVWISGIAALNNTYVWAHDMERPVYSDRRIDKVASLKNHIEGGFDRQSADRIAIEYLRQEFGIWP